VTTEPDLAEATRALARAYRFLERSLDELSMADYRMLAALVEGEERASRLAARLALGKPAVSATVESLVKRGLVVRAKVDGDNRAVALAITPLGFELFERTEAALTARLADLLSRTSDPNGMRTVLVGLGSAFDSIMVERMATR
jgi:DNA-binding MarR family transcriptional regulator